MKLPVAFLLSLTLASPGQAMLQEEAIVAMHEGIPQVAIPKLRQILASNPDVADINATRMSLAKAYLQLKRTNEARALLAQSPATEEASFLIVQSHLTDQNWERVVRLLKSLPPTDSAFYTKSVFARAEAYRGLHQLEQALEDYRLLQADPEFGNLARLRDADLFLQKNRHSEFKLQITKADDLASIQAATLLTAESCLQTGNFAQAEHHFRALVKNPVRLDATAFAAAHLGLARSLAGLKRPDEAGDALETFIDFHPRSAALSEMLAELNRIYRKQSNPSQNQLRRWSRDSTHPERQAISIYYQSQFDLRDKGSNAALATLSGWLDKFAKHPMRANVLLHYGEQLISEHKWADGLKRLNEGLSLSQTPVTTGEIHVALANALFQTERFSLAAEHFQQAARMLSNSTETLLYNAALSWLRASDFQKFLRVYDEFSSLFPESYLRSSLLVEEGFLQARGGAFDEAKETLNLFIRDFSSHSRVADAHLALAEIAHDTLPEISQKELFLASESSASKEIKERSAYLGFLQDSSETSSEKASKSQILRCETFLKTYPESDFEAEVRFKLGEAYFAEKDYTAAGAQFELIISRFSKSALLEQAYFLAGQSAIRTMNSNSVNGAIEQFEKVVRMKGPLQGYARFEQASIKRNNGAYEEALVLYNDLLEQNPPTDLLASTLAAKGETLYFEASQDLKKLDDSIKTFDQLASLPDISRYWKNLAFYKKAKALQWLGKKDEMLAAYYDALALPADAFGTPEYYWFYRAGFDAAESLESDEQWEASIAIYRKLAKAKGPRAAEVEERIKRLRLEHFIWDK